MGEFVCRVADANGRVFSHVEAAGTLEEARQKMVDRGLYVYSVETRGTLTGFLNRRSQRQKPTWPKVNSRSTCFEWMLS